MQSQTQSQMQTQLQNIREKFEAVLSTISDTRDTRKSLTVCPANLNKHMLDFDLGGDTYSQVNTYSVLSYNMLSRCTLKSTTISSYNTVVVGDIDIVITLNEAFDTSCVCVPIIIELIYANMKPFMGLLLMHENTLFFFNPYDIYPKSQLGNINDVRHHVDSAFSDLAKHLQVGYELSGDWMPFNEYLGKKFADLYSNSIVTCFEFAKRVKKYEGYEDRIVDAAINFENYEMTYPTGGNYTQYDYCPPESSVRCLLIHPMHTYGEKWWLNGFYKPEADHVDITSIAKLSEYLDTEFGSINKDGANDNTSDIVWVTLKDDSINDAIDDSTNNAIDDSTKEVDSREHVTANEVQHDNVNNAIIDNVNNNYVSPVELASRFFYAIPHDDIDLFKQCYEQDSTNSIMHHVYAVFMGSKKIIEYLFNTGDCKQYHKEVFRLCVERKNPDIEIIKFVHNVISHS